ncbi:hypothetical protein ATZ36_17990 [Candidatus Endomicrobiellum trichonymphae]|uniref:Uncharacterized protein n=1 Tax=Endomicrobium trichonymphae TaxID=1408204 RepID=A0A1E5IK22_ENDTX|nr:hypothetical protein ATZ36_17990 [Candidatus Endomicrobium trichonymphae]
MFLEKLKKHTKYVMLFSGVSGNRDDFFNALKKILLEALSDNYIGNFLTLRNIRLFQQFTLQINPT